jgi:hypothetical protein
MYRSLKKLFHELIQQYPYGIADNITKLSEHPYCSGGMIHQMPVPNLRQNRIHIKNPEPDFYINNKTEDSQTRVYSTGESDTLLAYANWYSSLTRHLITDVQSVLH